jgi:hypothetical protein
MVEDTKIEQKRKTHRHEYTHTPRGTAVTDVEKNVRKSHRGRK